jgi:acyl-CoA synthetase (AMP-forming)/AMP-acid ligase II
MASPTAIRDLGQVIREQATARADEVAFVCDQRRTTYAELNRRTNRVANGLSAITNGQQPRVALLDKNSDVFFEIWIGATKSGHVLAPVNWRLAPPEVAYIVNDASAEVLFVGEAFFPIVTQILPGLRTIRRIIALSGNHPDWEAYETWRDSQSDADPEQAIHGDAVALQLYTSGTTGHPKGALITHANISAALQAAPEWYPCFEDDVNLLCMPEFHVAGAFVGMLGLHAGARTIIPREPAPLELFRLIESERVTITFLVPALILFMLQTPGCDQVDFSSLKQIDYGASPIAADLLQRAIARFKCRFGQLYGLTETTGVVTYLHPEEHEPSGGQRMRSCGRPIGGVEIKVVGGDDSEMASGEVGEIVVRSPQVIPGYWNLHEASSIAIRDGWLHTGDAGYFDSDGYLYVYDRVKDMIVSGGENIYPAEVESALFGHPAVADVAVIGVPDDRWGEAVKAIVVLTPGAVATESDLIVYCRDQIAHYKAPKSVDFAESLPRNPTGKLLKRVLRAKYWEGRERLVN